MSAVNDLLKKHDIAIHVPKNHTNLFQPLDIPVKKSAKCFIADKYQDWYAEKVLQQLNRSVAVHNVKVDVKLSIMKPLHAKWIIEMYHHLKRFKQIVISGFRKAHILEAVSGADQLAQLCENPFAESFMVTDWKLNLEYSSYITLWSISFISSGKKNKHICVHFIILYC